MKFSIKDMVTFTEEIILSGNDFLWIVLIGKSTNFSPMFTLKT